MISNSFLKIFLILSAIKLYHETNLLAVVIVFSLIISDVIRHKLLGLFADLCTSSYRTTIDMKTTLRLKKKLKVSMKGEINLIILNAGKLNQT